MKREFWLDRPVFVTGATGLCGSALVSQLVELGASVVVIIRDWVPESELIRHKGLLSGVTVIRGDVEDRLTIERVLNEYEIRTVFHLAAQTIVGTANRNPVSTFETNIRGTWNVLEACRRTSTIEEIIVASSDKAYGSHDDLPYSEDAPLAGRHPYDVSKSCADLISQSYAHTFGLPVSVTRCGNLYGPGDLNWNRLIPGTIRSVIRGENPYIRSDGKSIRDYFYVEDAAMAYTTLAEAINSRDGVRGQAFNFSNELQVTVAEVAETILGMMDRKDLKPVVGNVAANEIMHQYLSAKKARDLLGWSPAFSLTDGLSRTIDWYRDLLARDGDLATGETAGSVGI